MSQFCAACQLGQHCGQCVCCKKRPALYHYPGWVQQVNLSLARLSHNLFSAQDFDYPWIEAFMKGADPETAAKAALAGDGEPIATTASDEEVA